MHLMKCLFNILGRFIISLNSLRTMFSAGSTNHKFIKFNSNSSIIYHGGRKLPEVYIYDNKENFIKFDLIRLIVSFFFNKCVLYNILSFIVIAIIVNAVSKTTPIVYTYIMADWNEWQIWAMSCYIIDDLWIN